MGGRELVKPTPYTPRLKVWDAGSVSQMTPRSSTTKVRDGMFPASNNFGYLGNAVLPGEVERPYLTSLLFGKRVVPEGFAFWHLPRVPSFEVSRWFRVPASINTILHILSMRAPAQMLRIAAWRIVAGVKREGSGSWWSAINKDAGKPRGGYFQSAFVAFNIEKAVTKAMEALTHPRPALIIAALVNIAPEKINFILRKFHCYNPFTSMKRDYHIEGVG